MIAPIFEPEIRVQVRGCYACLMGAHHEEAVELPHRVGVGRVGVGMHDVGRVLHPVIVGVTRRALSPYRSRRQTAAVRSAFQRQEDMTCHVYM